VASKAQAAASINATGDDKNAHRGADDGGGGGGGEGGVGKEGVVMAATASTAHAPDPTAAAAGLTVDSAVDPSGKVWCFDFVLSSFQAECIFFKLTHALILFSCVFIITDMAIICFYCLL